MKQSDQIQKPRRRFLQQLMVLGGATGAGAMAFNATQQDTQASRADTQPDKGVAPAKGYRLTEHIRTYYEKARI